MAADPPKVPALPQTAPALEPWFGSRLEGLGPFEPAPALAVAVSGGVDSLTLLALTCRWARARGGRVVALCVNHGLRAAAAGEAARVQRQAEAWGAEGIILTRPDRPPQTSLQEEARIFRHAALEEACRARGVLHLLLAHHQNDQAETVLERLARSSGPDGLAAMASITHRPGVRLLRPFLDVPKTALVATAHALGLSWDEDPSNQDPRFERARWRALAPPWPPRA
ncbi:tRNA lysidine(34) synthetase TilS [Pararhodospirillum photometricum]|uniref:tRNA lysidine(34) synthetase TilS n=1 Tax=Pararhodospirillum photometricum TaxID=1084 RepID=UPI0006887B2E|nr:tRNA lysidine(34) synthetase TilS [Pararhodospirillum photometricum]